VLASIEAKRRVQVLPDPAFTFADLFSGIGGMRMGFEAVGGRCVFASDWDPWCQRTYRANFVVDHPLVGDIRHVPENEIPRHDVLLAGFPCQPFSIAGVSARNALGQPHGFRCQAQGTLFFEIARILAFHRPAEEGFLTSPKRRNAL
jgi:DNA (cytosine-5)-methyltransferase 1